MNTTYRVHPRAYRVHPRAYRVHQRAKIASHDTMIYFQHPGARYQVLATGTLLANKQVEQCELAQGRDVM